MSTRAHTFALRLFARAASAIALTCLFASGAAAQLPTPDQILGFETASSWTVISLLPGTAASSTTNRTQGSFAHQVVSPPNMLMVSLPVASSAQALAGIGSPGAQFQLDLFVPVQQGNNKNVAVTLLITAWARGLNNVSVAKVSLTGLRAGLYNTVTFPIPRSVGNALRPGSFHYLAFGLLVSASGKTTGTYRFDNLRVRSAPLLQDAAGASPPPGYGGSVDLVVFGDAPVTQAFPLGPTQIPAGFHLRAGTAGPTSVQLKLGLDGQPTLTCTYGPDTADAANESYIVNSCTSGFQPGDIVSANWVSLGIVGGDNTQKIRAQLSKNPLGTKMGAGLLPPMPTFWGDADGCIPQPIAGQVVTLSPSCANQINQANQIAIDYSNRLRAANPSPDWIVRPVPEWAQRHGNGAPVDGLSGAPPPPPLDPPFDNSGHLNPGGTFDAYWRLFGNLTPAQFPGTDRATTHFEASFGAHAVVFGEDVNVLEAKIVADTDSGQTTPTFKNATATGGLGLYLFGVQAFGETMSPGVSFSIDPKFSDDLELPSIHIWIFSITLGATVEAELEASGSASVQGVNLSATPSGTIGAFAKGGVDLGVASGTVNAQVELLKVATPIVAQAKWVLDTTPQVCAFTLDGGLKGDLAFSSGGGKIDLDATFGICPLCHTESKRLFSWKPLLHEDWSLFDAAINLQLFGLPASVCSFPITVAITAPTSGTTLTQGVPRVLSASAKPTDDTLQVHSATYSWTYTPGANASTVTVNQNGTTANPTVTFGPPTSGTSSTWTIQVSASVTVMSAGGTLITTTGVSAPVTITVGLGSGVAITQIVSTGFGPAIPDANSVFVVGLGQGSTNTVFGTVMGVSGPLSTAFTIELCLDGDAAGYTPTCATAKPPITLTTDNAGTTSPSATFSIGQGTYRIRMITGGSKSITDEVLVYGFGVF